MDRSALRKQVFKELATSAWVLLPAAAGLTAIFVGWALGQGTALLSFLGIAGILAGAGALVTRWILKGDDLIHSAIEKLQNQARAQREAELDQLQRRLESDNDPRTGESLRILRDLEAQFRLMLKESAESNATPPVEIVSMVERLIRSSISSLEKSLTLWQAAQRMMTRQASQNALQRREGVLVEVERSIRQMAKTLDGIREMSLKAQSATQLAAIRKELDTSLQVARRVEERMRSLEDDIVVQTSGGIELKDHE